MVFYDEPIQTTLVTCRGHSDMTGKMLQRDNIITVDWTMPVSFKPALYAISIGKTRFSLGLIQSSKCFVVNFMDYSQVDKVLFCGRNSGANTDKFKEVGLVKKEADKIECPRIGDALAYLECEVVDEIDAGDHVVFIGKMIGGEYIKDGNRVFHTTADNFVEFKR